VPVRGARRGGGRCGGAGGGGAGDDCAARIRTEAGEAGSARHHCGLIRCAGGRQGWGDRRGLSPRLCWHLYAWLT
jgi:hypothetical protein